MDPNYPYSPFADWLSKFYLASEPIQALWIVALSATALGVTWIVMRGVADVARVVVRRRERLVVRDGEGWWMVEHAGNASEALDWAEAQPQLIGREISLRTAERQ
jgi:hypothetical protein